MPVQDPRRADHRCVADVGHVRLVEDEEDARGGQQQEPAGEEVHRQGSAERSSAQRCGAATTPQHPAEEVEKRRVGEPHRRFSVPRVEQGVGDTEAQHHRHVEMTEAGPAR